MLPNDAIEQAYEEYIKTNDYKNFKKHLQLGIPFKMMVTTKQAKRVEETCIELGIEFCGLDPSEIRYLYFSNEYSQEFQMEWSNSEGEDNFNSRKEERFYLETDSFDSK